MDLLFLTDNIINAVGQIVSGRKGFATRGKEHEGRISYEEGIALAMSVFQEAQDAADPQALLLAEYTFLSQELELCNKSFKKTLSSLKQALQLFDDAFLALKAIDDPRYTIAEELFPHIGKYRYSGFPKDAYHIAFASHNTRIQNNLRYTGLDPIENALLELRLANLAVAQKAYAELQRKAFQITINN